MTKIAIVGAGSHVFARRLIADVLTWPSLKDSTIALMDMNQGRLDLMAALARRMVEQEHTGARVEPSTDLKTALDGADYVFVTIRVGRGAQLCRHPHEVRHQPGHRRHQRARAASSTSCATPRRSIEIAHTMEQVCPDALMLNYTNPMVMLCWALHELTKVRFVGLCHSVQGTAMTLAEYLGVPFEEVSYWVAGINHMAWFLEYQPQGPGCLSPALGGHEEARDL